MKTEGNGIKNIGSVNCGPSHNFPVTYFLNHVVFITNYIAINTAYLCNTALMLGYYFKDGLTGAGGAPRWPEGVLFFVRM